MHLLPDGNYDVIVVDVEDADDGDLCIELTISLGPHVGNVIRLRGRHIEQGRGGCDAGDPFELLGVPGTLRVHGGQPIFRPETP